MVRATLLHLALPFTFSVVLKGMGTKFLDGYIALCEGEKDPRNLVLVFAMDRVILIEFDISERVQVRPTPPRLYHEITLHLS